MFRKIFLFIIIILLTILFGTQQPQMLALPLGLLVYLLRGPIRLILRPLKLSLAYILTGWGLGLCIEVFAIWQNIQLPIEKRNLFNQDPSTDLLIAVGFYLVVSIVLYLFAKRYNFSKKAFIGITAFYAIVVEQLGAVFIMGLTNPFLWLYIALIYGVWTVAPYLLFQDRFSERRRPAFWIYPVMLALMWAASFTGSILGTLLSKMI